MAQRSADGSARDRVRVAVDLTPLVAGNTGVALYTAKLWGALSESQAVELRGFAIGRRGRTPAGVRHLRIPLKVAHQLWRFPRAPGVRALAGDVDVAHAMDMFPPPARVPTVVTVHDLLPVTHPHLYDRHHRVISHRQVQAAREAAVVVAVSEATARVVTEVTGRAAEDVVVVPSGFEPVPDAGRRPMIEPPYILFVGALTPRKRLDALVRAHRRLGPGAPTVVAAGPDGLDADRVRAALRPDDDVRLLGRVSDEDLAALYRHAACVVHPSVAEGFGIPCLEAMGYGAPLVACDVPPVREVAGDAAWLVPPDDDDALAGALERVLGGGDDVRRRRALGLERAHDFTWPASAARLIEVYERASGGRDAGPRVRRR